MISNVKVYNLEETLVVSGYPMSVKSGMRETTENDMKRLKKLASAKSGSGHDCALKGILVTFDLTFTAPAWSQFQRYHFADIISSQSKMHRLTEMNIKQQCHEYVDEEVIERVEEYVRLYHEFKTIDKKLAKFYFDKALYNAPQGLKLTASVTTNYLQLKTIYAQRKLHKLDEWRVVCSQLKELPHSNLFTGE